MEVEVVSVYARKKSNTFGCGLSRCKDSDENDEGHIGQERHAGKHPAARPP